MYILHNNREPQLKIMLLFREKWEMGKWEISYRDNSILFEDL